MMDIISLSKVDKSTNKDLNPMIRRLFRKSLLKKLRNYGDEETINNFIDNNVISGDIMTDILIGSDFHRYLITRHNDIDDNGYANDRYLDERKDCKLGLPVFSSVPMMTYFKPQYPTLFEESYLSNNELHVPYLSIMLNKMVPIRLSKSNKYTTKRIDELAPYGYSYNTGNDQPIQLCSDEIRYNISRRRRSRKPRN
jgi:hypothetical protein